jgi:glycosyltransferase involved in cell wall biosynthesis
MINEFSDKRIALVTYTLNSGGVSVFIFNLARYLSIKGYIVDIIVTNTKGVWYNKINEINIKCIDRTYGLLQWFPFGNLINIAKLVLLFRFGRYGSIIINCSEPAHMAIAFAGNKSLNISVLHNNKPGVIRIGLTNKEFFHHIISVSPAVETSVRRKYNDYKLRTILNGVNIPELNLAPNHSEINQCIKILFVGRLTHEQKGIFLIPRILKGIIENGINFHFTIIGNGPDEVHFFEMLSSLGINEKITHYPMLDNSEVYKQYTQNHVFLMPSFYEGLPLALMESMMMGCVPVASRLTDSTDICIDNGIDGILLDIGDEKSFIENIAQLYLQPEYWVKLSNNAISKAQSKFTSERMGNEYYELINNQQMNLNRVPFWKPLLNLCSVINILPPIVIQKYNELKIKRHT